MKFFFVPPEPLLLLSHTLSQLKEMPRESFFTPRDDQLILQAARDPRNMRVNRRGTSCICWSSVAERVLSGFDHRQIRQRFLRVLNPQISFARWTVEEDRKLLKLAGESRPKWSQIAREFNGKRTDVQLRSRFRVLSRKQSKKAKEVQPETTMGGLLGSETGKENVGPQVQPSLGNEEVLFSYEFLDLQQQDSLHGYCERVDQSQQAAMSSLEQYVDLLHVFRDSL